MRLLPLILLACGTPDTPDDADTDVVETDVELADAPALDDLLAAGSFGVGVTDLTVVDDTRVTMANAEAPELPERTLALKVWYPSASGGVDNAVRDAEVSDAGPFPLVFHSHGLLSDNNHHAALGKYLASHGYAFAAIRFPLSNLQTPGGATVLDVVNQPADVSVALDALLGTTGGPTDGAFDPDRVVLSGLSLGAMTTLLTGLTPGWLDDRAAAIAVMAPPSCFVPLASFDAPTPPTLIVHGDEDALVPYDENAVPLFEALDAPKTFVTLLGGTHTGFPDITGALFDNMPHADQVGCDSIEGSVPEDDEGVDAVLPGPYLGQDCALPCEGELIDDAMKPTRQVELLMVILRSWLDVTVGDGGELAGEIDAQHDVSVEMVLP